MNKNLIEKYLNTLYLKSKNDLRSGYSYKIIAGILGLDRITSQNMVHYLSGKNLIDTKNGYGNNISLTAQGFDYVDAFREDKVFKTINFIKAIYVPPASKMEYGFLFWYNITDELGNKEEKQIGVYTSDVLTMTWGLKFDTLNIANTESIFVQLAKDEITKRIIDTTLSPYEAVSLVTATQPPVCPYNSENSVETKYMEFEVEIKNIVITQPEKQIKVDLQEIPKDYPCVFISYSWDNEEHKKWVLDFAKRLFEKRIHVILDRFELSAGKNMIHFMESSINTADKVLIIFTPNYKAKADKREGGVGYEYSILNAEIYHRVITNEKFIPVLRSGNFIDSIPSFMQQFIAVDMTNPDLFEEKLNEVVHAVYNKPLIEKPMLGENPFS